MSLLLLMDETLINSNVGLKFASYNCQGFNDAKCFIFVKIVRVL